MGVCESDTRAKDQTANCPITEPNSPISPSIEMLNSKVSVICHYFH